MNLIISFHLYSVHIYLKPTEPGIEKCFKKYRFAQLAETLTYIYNLGIQSLVFFCPTGNVRPILRILTFEMPGRHFPIVNQQSGLALEASNRGNAVVELKEYADGRDCQLWFKVDETIRSKVKQVQTKVRCNV